jgi:hypothetical protein
MLFDVIGAFVMAEAFSPLLSLWENKNKSQIFNCRYSEHLSVYFLTEWLKSGFLVKVLCSIRLDTRKLHVFFTATPSY